MSWVALLKTVVSLGLVVGTSAIGPVTDLHIVNADVTPDGVTRTAVLAEGVFPGPPITGTNGDNFQINVIDQLTNETMLESTSVHWHGLFQKGTAWADGPAFVTQCPIVTGNSFLYDFTVNQTGTYWYHSHLALQYGDGLRGPLVIYDPYDPQAYLYDVDNESTIITLADWYHTAAVNLTPGQPADSTLINGLGRAFGSTNQSELAVITVESGKRYRFRLVSISFEPNYVFSIDSHNMTIIEVEGVNTQPLLVDSIQIFAAQRYSFVLEANQPVDNYWIRAIPNFGNTTTTNGVNSAILRYVGAPDQDPAPSNPPVSVIPLVETNLHPLNNPGVPGEPVVGGVDFARNLVFSFNANNATFPFAIDGTPFVPPTVPVLLQILSGTQNPQDLLPNGSIIALPPDSTIEISMPIPTNGIPGGPHPFHLHGHNFFVVRSAGNSTYNFDNPVIRDTVSTGAPGDNVTIRFETNNPGPWFLHCHIDPHLNAGFALVFAEDIPDIATANPVPEAWDQLCPLYDALPPGSQ